MRAPCVLTLLWFGVTACRTSAPAELSATDQRTARAEHFEVLWHAGDASEAEVQAVLARAESSYRALEALLGARRMARERLNIRLNGDAQQGEMPTVSPQTGELVMVRFPGRGGGYEASIAHELVHALRLKLTLEPARQTDVYLFIEEGLAELLAIAAGFPSTGFPTYGAPIAIAGGTWVATDEDLALSALVRRHRALNFRCMPQAYAQRLSFMVYLERRIGLQAIIELAYADKVLTAEDLERVTGESLEVSAAAWRAWALGEYRAIVDADQQAAAYRQGSPIKYLPVCKREVAL